MNGFSSLASQKARVRKGLATELSLYKVWEPIPMDWFQRWKKYVDFDNTEKDMRSQEEIDSLHPGQIDSSCLLGDFGDELSRDISADVDFVLLPRESVDDIFNYYQSPNPQNRFSRVVRNVGTEFEPYYQIKLYPTRIELFSLDANDKPQMKAFNYFHSCKTLKDVKYELKGSKSSVGKKVGIDHISAFRLWFRLKKKEVTDCDESRNLLRHLTLDKVSIVDGWKLLLSDEMNIEDLMTERHCVELLAEVVKDRMIDYSSYTPKWEEWPRFSALNAWQDSLLAGDVIDVYRRSDRKWLEALVTEVRTDGVVVHYWTFDNSEDEFIERRQFCNRIAALNCYTSKWRGAIEQVVVKSESINLKIDVKYTDSIDSVKRKIYEKGDIPIHQKRLKYNNERLACDRTLNNCGINSHSTIFMKLSEIKHIKVKTETSTIQLSVDQIDPIEKIKQSLYDRVGVHPEDQRLIFNEKELESECTVKHYELEDNSVLELKLVEGYRIFVRTRIGKIITMRIQSTDTSETVKQLVLEREGIPMDQQILTFSGRKLEDGRSLHEYGIRAESTLHLARRLEGNTKLKYRGIEMEFQPNDSILKVKQMFSDILLSTAGNNPFALDRHICHLTGLIGGPMTYDDVSLEDNLTLQDYSIHSGCNLSYKTHYYGCSMFIKKPTGGFTDLLGRGHLLRNINLVPRLKQVIYQTEGYPPEQQRLFYGDKELEDDKKLGEYLPNCESTLHLKLRQAENGDFVSKHISKVLVGNTELQSSIPQSHAANSTTITIVLKDNSDANITDIIVSDNTDQIIEGSISFNSESRTVVFNLNTPLQYSTKYSISIEGRKISTGLRITPAKYIVKTTNFSIILSSSGHYERFTLPAPCETSKIQQFCKNIFGLSCKLEQITLNLQHPTGTVTEISNDALVRTLAYNDWLSIAISNADSTRLNIDSSSNRNNNLTNINWTSISKESAICRGSFSTVYSGSWRGSKVAIKVLRPDLSSAAAAEAELQILANLRHPRLVLLMGVCRDLPDSEGSIALVLEYLEKGSLFNILRSDYKNLTLVDKLRIAIDICDGMRFLHQSNVLHRDLKSANIFVDENGRAKVGDFGLSVVKGTSATHATGMIGTAAWTAPEIFAGGEARVSSDVYSFGVIMWELFTGEVPWGDRSIFQIIGASMKGQTLKVPEPSETFPPSVHKLISISLGEERGRPLFSDLFPELQRLIREASGAARKIPSSFFCPITCEVMRDPVLCADGFSYERSAIEHWLLVSPRSPMTNCELPNTDVTPNLALKQAIEEVLS